MAITVTSKTVNGTDCPWKFGGSASSGAANALVAYNQGYNDGSNAGGGSGSLNSAYRYGQQHVSPSGETGPATVNVTAGQRIILIYNSGTVATQGSGAGNSTPAGSVTTTLTPQPGGETDSGGYTLPTNVIVGFKGYNGNGTVNTAGTAVTKTAGTAFDPSMAGGTIWINNAAFTVASVQSTTTLTLSATAGTQSGVGFFFYSATTSIGGLVGAFVDGSDNILSTFDWKSYGGTTSTGSSIELLAPTGATKLSLGINDTILRDNTGSFSLTVVQMDGTFDWFGDEGFFKQYPVGISAPAGLRDQTALGTPHAINIKQLVFLATYWIPQMTAGSKLIKDYTGQQFPHGGQNSGGTPPGYGQNFPY